MTYYCPICDSTHNIWHYVKSNKWYCGQCGYILNLIMKNKKYQIICEDFRKVLPMIKEKYIIITDPPYNQMHRSYESLRRFPIFLKSLPLPVSLREIVFLFFYTQSCVAVVLHDSNRFQLVQAHVRKVCNNCLHNCFL